MFARCWSRVRNRPQPSATARGEAISVCHWDSLWKRVFDGAASAVFIGPVRELSFASSTRGVLEGIRVAGAAAKRAF